MTSIITPTTTIDFVCVKSCDLDKIRTPTTTPNFRIQAGDQGTRPGINSIHYMLCPGQIGILHRNKSDNLHYFMTGLPLEYLLVDPEKKTLEKIVLGPDISQGQRLFFRCPGGVWKATRVQSHPAGHPLAEADFALVSEVVSPGFRYEDREVATEDYVARELPDLYEILKPFIHHSHA